MDSFSPDSPSSPQEDKRHSQCLSGVIYAARRISKHMYSMLTLAVVLLASPTPDSSSPKTSGRGSDGTCHPKQVGLGRERGAPPRTLSSCVQWAKVDCLDS